MDRITRRVFVLLCLLVANISVFAGTKGTGRPKFDWNPVMDAIIQVESEGNAKAISGNSCGAMQITPIMVKECNNILEKNKSSKRYRLADRFNVAKSKEMFVLFQSYYNKGNNVEQAIRSWNGGMNYSRRGTQRYFNKVMKLLK